MQKYIDQSSPYVFYVTKVGFVFICIRNEKKNIFLLVYKLYCCGQVVK